MSSGECDAVGRKVEGGTRRKVKREREEKREEKKKGERKKERNGRGENDARSRLALLHNFIALSSAFVQRDGREKEEKKRTEREVEREACARMQRHVVYYSPGGIFPRANDTMGTRFA